MSLAAVGKFEEAQNELSIALFGLDLRCLLIHPSGDFRRQIHKPENINWGVIIMWNLYVNCF